MKTEFEAKFLNINIDQIRQKLTELGATLEQPMRLMKRAIIDNDFLSSKNAFVRIRDEGHKVSLTYKQFDDLSVDGAKEHEVVVSDFNETLALLDAVGLVHKSLQESKRETWKHGNVEIVIDEWPWLDLYIEIEADSEAAVKDFTEKLGFNWNNAVFGDVMAAYRVQYPHLSKDQTVGSIPSIKFGDPLPALLQT